MSVDHLERASKATSPSCTRPPDIELADVVISTTDTDFEFVVSKPSSDPRCVICRDFDEPSCDHPQEERTDWPHLERDVGWGRMIRWATPKDLRPDGSGGYEWNIAGVKRLGDDLYLVDALTCDDDVRFLDDRDVVIFNSKVRACDTWRLEQFASLGHWTGFVGLEGRDKTSFDDFLNVVRQTRDPVGALVRAARWF